eukprot:TRINITY_DN1008_c0_g1_i4.p1 TRINITY_DN1008_c0_g1~~TRINITY_DN1008_c0_g1_i4.p1  ORF type:complete len:1179 (-),score=303.89 TRINITY_DN1008_c0_g1_i4:414-3950(-)
MSIAAVAPRHVFGLKGNVRDNICYLDEQTLIYPAGQNIISYNTEQKIQKFIPGTEKTDGIVAMCISPNRRYCAISERADKGMITIFDLHSMKRRKVLSHPELATKEFVCMCFSADSKSLLAQGGDPDWTLVLWSWDKAKILASMKVSNATNSTVHQCSFNPQDSTQICVSGNGIFKLFRFVDGQLKSLPGSMGKREAQNYLCHGWVSDERIILGTDAGELMLVELGELKALLTSPSSEGASIESILCFSKGFICAGDGGSLAIYEKSDDKEYYRKAKQIKVENNTSKIRNVAMSPSEEIVSCATENNQIYVLTLSSSDILKSEEMTFELLAQPFHSLQITGVDTCMRKPLIATCGTDRSVRIWNYVDRTLELHKTFAEEAYSVAFHPSGFHVLVGFSDKLRLMNLLMDDIRPYKEFTIRGCRECRFSNGGQLFAAVNGNTIQIFSSYSFENIGNLRGHNSKVRSISWTPDDSRIISAGMDGAVYEWKLRDFKREGENVLKTCNYTCAVITPDSRTTFAVGSDKKLKEISDSQINKDFDTGIALTQVVLSHSGRMLFAGTESGSIRSYKFPLTGEFQEHQCHSESVSRMRISFDDSFLFTVGEDGCLFIFDIRDKEGRQQKREKDAPFAEEILVTKSDLEEKTQLMQELKTKVDELTMQNEYQMRLKDLNYTEKTKELTEKFTQEIEADKARYEVLLQEKNDMEIEYEDKIKQIEERHQLALQELEAQYQQKIMGEVERYHSLVQEKEHQNERWDEQHTLMLENHERAMQELMEDYENKLQEDQQLMQRSEQEKEERLREYEETKRQLEEDADREIEELKEKYEAKLAAERDTCLRYKGENGIMKKKFSALQKDIEDQKEEIKLLFEQKKELYSQISALEKDIAGLKKEIKERDETIGDKEKRIYDLKKKNQELEKFKFVLDYKIKELKKQIEPREMEITDMKEQIKEMDQELERYHKNNGNLDLRINDLNLKVEGLNKEILDLRQKIHDYEGVLKRFRTDLHDTVQHIQDPKALKDSVKQLYQKHAIQNVQTQHLDVDIEKEYSRQRDYLEKSVSSLRRKLTKDSEIHRADNVRIMQENVELITEINALRRELKAIKQVTKKDGTATEPMSPGLRKSTTRDTEFESFPAEAVKMIEMQREEIQRLRDQVNILDASRVSSRPLSRERLPPMDGFEDRVH